ncbi:hypothetical protein [Amycolatopsis sp. w19]|uniref:hypothetical protein n=1 Tax=Amycolatopsis sp. w19 TaxID=3448134 RepID=UPI003F1A59C7
MNWNTLRPTAGTVPVFLILKVKVTFSSVRNSPLSKATDDTSCSRSACGFGATGGALSAADELGGALELAGASDVAGALDAGDEGAGSAPAGAANTPVNAATAAKVAR